QGARDDRRHRASRCRPPAHAGAADQALRNARRGVAPGAAPWPAHRGNPRRAARLRRRSDRRAARKPRDLTHGRPRACGHADRTTEIDRGDTTMSYLAPARLAPMPSGLAPSTTVVAPQKEALWAQRWKALGFIALVGFVLSANYTNHGPLV